MAFDRKKMNVTVESVQNSAQVTF